MPHDFHSLRNCHRQFLFHSKPLLFHDGFLRDFSFKKASVLELKNQELHKFPLSLEFGDASQYVTFMSKVDKEITHPKNTPRKSLRNETKRSSTETDSTDRARTQARTREEVSRRLMSILPRGGAFLGVGAGTISSGTGFLGGAGTLETLCTFRALTLSHGSPAHSTPTDATPRHQKLPSHLCLEA